MYTYHITFLLSFVSRALGQNNQNVAERFEEAYQLAEASLTHFTTLYIECVQTPMPAQRYFIDDLQAYLFHPAKTTVGYAPKFTANRKFFANLVGTTSFHQMLAKDMEELRGNLLAKLKFCDNSVMDQEMLKDIYDRGVFEFEEHVMK